MKQNFDFHIHTINSDGQYTTKEIIELLKKNNINHFSITDHDNIDSINDMNNINTKLDYITGVELSGEYKKYKMHILGYYIDGNTKKIINICNKIKEARIERFYSLLDELNNKFNIKFNNDDIKYIINNKNIIAKPHIAQLLIKYNYVINIKEAFDKYLKNIRSGIDFRKDASVIIDAIKSAGGIVILAHPIKIEEKHNIDIESIIDELIYLGFDGLEIYNSIHSNNDSERYMNICKKYDLLMSGGSDYHGPEVKPNVNLGILNYEPLEKINIKTLTFKK